MKYGPAYTSLNKMQKLLSFLSTYLHFPPLLIWELELKDLMIFFYFAETFTGLLNHLPESVLEMLALINFSNSLMNSSELVIDFCMTTVSDQFQMPKTISNS